MESSQPLSAPGELPDEMAEVINEFLVESNEGLDRFDRDLIALEKDRTSRDLLDSIFRAVHTIKGTGGVLGFEKLVSVSHLGESVLSRMRDGVLLLSPQIATALLAMADSLRHMLENISSAGNEGDEDCSGVRRQLQDILGDPAPAPATGFVHVDLEAPPRLGEILVSAATCRPDDVNAAIEQQERGDDRPIGEILVENSGVCPTAVAEGLKA